MGTLVHKCETCLRMSQKLRYWGEEDAVGMSPGSNPALGEDKTHRAYPRLWNFGNPKPKPTLNPKPKKVAIRVLGHGELGWQESQSLCSHVPDGDRRGPQTLNSKPYKP